VRKQYQSHIIAFLGTLLSMGLIFLLLWFLQVKAPVFVEDEGIIVLFGNSEDGGGMPDVSYTDPFTQVEQIPAPATPSRSSNNEYIVQDSDESLALSKQSRDDSKDNANDEVHIQTARAESARADSIARAHALAEQKAKEQEAIDKANQLAALFGQAGTTSGASGDAHNTATSSKGNPVGNPVGKGFGSIDNATWTLQGRSCKYIPQPSSDFNQQGRVVVNIMVDAAGNVTSASVGDGSTISDRETQKLALESARNAKFSEGENTQRGTIMYVFKYAEN
jgi:TonB family protein